MRVAVTTTSPSLTGLPVAASRDRWCLPAAAARLRMAAVGPLWTSPCRCLPACGDEASAEIAGGGPLLSAASQNAGLNTNVKMAKKMPLARFCLTDLHLVDLGLWRSVHGRDSQTLDAGR